MGVNLTWVQSKKASGFDVTLGFTKANELFVGRLAMLGVSFACLGEIITGKGAIAQLGFETGISPVDADGLILGLIGFNLIAAFFPASGKFVVEQEEEAAASSKEKVGFFKDGDDKLFKGGFGFTKDNELFVGRMAQLGFAASLIGEVITGKGALAQFNCETVIPLADAEPLLLFSIVLLGLTAVNEGTGKFVDEK